jgi:hypothetical protein
MGRLRDAPLNTILPTPYPISHDSTIGGKRGGYTQMDMRKNKRGVWENLSAMALGIVTFVVIGAVGALILANIGSNSTVSADANATAVINYGKAGLNSLTSWIGVIVVVAVGAILIALIAGYFMQRRK